jgi:18S rRNA (guanine1575-N7)-methyltransferase
MSRPEDTPPELYYNDKESRAYTTSSRVQHIQTQMTERALELLDLDTPSLILDVGCGSGLSGEILTSTDPSHTWIGMDISASMLAVARMDRDVDGDLFLADMGQGVPFRPGTFDAAISISAVQWLCNAETSEENEAPDRRLKRFFSGLYVSLKRGGRAVLQFYPRDKNQRDMICKAAISAGFGAGLLEDDGGTKNAKTYLVCTVGGGDVTGVVEGMDGVDVEDSRRGTSKVKRGVDTSNIRGTKAWINRKKEQSEKKGKVVKASSKFTGRKRKIKW